MNVLLVEDDDDIRRLVADLLIEEHGVQVVDFAAAEPAWQVYQAEPFPLVILDWMLPGMDGLELCRLIKRSAQGERSIVLVMTARTGAGQLAKVMDAGADDYLAKPIDIHLFDIRLTVARRRVREVAARLRAQQALQEAARLEGVLLAARTAAHEINNALSLPVGYSELLLEHPTIKADPALHTRVLEILDSAQRAASTLRRLQNVIRLEEAPSGLGPERPLLDIDRSTAAE